MQASVASTDAGVLFETYRGAIRRYVGRMVRDSAHADDLTQETFVRACRHADSLRDPQAALGWLYRIATNVCLDHLRARHPEVSLERCTVPLSSRASSGVTAHEVTERAETSRCVQRCLEYLPDSYRSVLLLFESESLTANEIASLLDVKLTTVKMRLHRARNMLRTVMACGCMVKTDSAGLPTCQPKVNVLKRGS